MTYRQGIALVLLFWFVAAWAGAAPVPGEVIQAVEKIKRADYEGDRVALKQLTEELATYADHEDFGSRVRYWQGFALWRRAINGFNEDSPDPKDLLQDLLQAIDEFHKASVQDPGFWDAKIGEVGCMGYVAYIHREDKERAKEIIAGMAPLRKELVAAVPDNPRLIWVMGPWLWNTPVERGGGQELAMETYRRGLDLIRNQNRNGNDPLEPSWGEPELLMNLAYFYLHRAEPDIEAAEQHARAALAMVPYWHYVRDILLPQILEAKEKMKNEPSPGRDTRQTD